MPAKPANARVLMEISRGSRFAEPSAVVLAEALRLHLLQLE